MVKGWWAIILSLGMILFAGYLVGVIGVNADCGPVCECIGKQEGNLCTGINLSVNQLRAVVEMKQLL